MIENFWTRSNYKTIEYFFFCKQKLELTKISIFKLKFHSTEFLYKKIKILSMYHF